MRRASSASATAWSKRKKGCASAMRSLYRTLSLRYLRQRWSRAALVIATIALGVATLVATRALNESMTAAARGASTPLAESADLVVSNGEAGVNPKLAAELTRVAGVRQVESMVDGRVRLPDLSTLEQPRNARLLGVIWKEKAADSNPWNVKIDWAVPPESMPAPENAVAQLLAPILKSLGAESLLPLLKKVGIRPVVVGKELADDLPHDMTAILVEELWPVVEELRGKLPAEIRATITRDRVEGLA